MGACKCNIQIRYPEVEMPTQGQCLSADISIKGHHISVLYIQVCFICFVVWPTTKIWNFWKYQNSFQSFIAKLHWI